MKQLQPVDDDVYAELQALAEPLVDDINSVLRRLLEHYHHTAAAAPRPAAHPVTGGTSPGVRARRQPTLTDVDYELPLLRALLKLGGEGPTSTVTDEVGRLLADRLKAADKATLKSGDVRWRNRTAFARLNLVKRGEMDGSTPRGIWAITAQGRDRVREAGPA